MVRLSSKGLLVVLAVATSTLVALAPSTVRAEDWGHLSGTFVLDGDGGMPVEIQPTKDQEFCGKHKIFDESVTVNPENKGIANVILFLSLKRGDKAPAVHPYYEESAKAEVTIDNDQCRFQPHVVLMRTSQTLIIGNKDAIAHNTKIDTFANPAINPLVPGGGTLKQTYAKEERLPAKVSCSIHPWMNAWLVVKDNPYFAVTDKDGKFRIENIPAGEWRFQVYHTKFITQANVSGKAVKWAKGQMTQKITAGDNDLGVIKVALSELK